MNDLSREGKVISTKGSRKDLVNWYSILNGADNFTEDR